MDCTWSYVLLGEDAFYGMGRNGATTEDILENAKLTTSKVKGELESYF